MASSPTINLILVALSFAAVVTVGKAQEEPALPANGVRYQLTSTYVAQVWTEGTKFHVRAWDTDASASNKWHAIGFNAAAMMMSGTSLITMPDMAIKYASGKSKPQDNMWTNFLDTQSSAVAGVPFSHEFSFALKDVPTNSAYLVWAIGSGASFASHSARGTTPFTNNLNPTTATSTTTSSVCTDRASCAALEPSCGDDSCNCISGECIYRSTTTSSTTTMAPTTTTEAGSGEDTTTANMPSTTTSTTTTTTTKTKTMTMTMSMSSSTARSSTGTTTGTSTKTTTGMPSSTSTAPRPTTTDAGSGEETTTGDMMGSTTTTTSGMRRTTTTDMMSTTTTTTQRDDTTTTSSATPGVSLITSTVPDDDAMGSSDKSTTAAPSTKKGGDTTAVAIGVVCGVLIVGLAVVVVYRRGTERRIRSKLALEEFDNPVYADAADPNAAGGFSGQGDNYMTIQGAQEFDTVA